MEEFIEQYPFIFILIFVVFWLGAMKLSSYLSGWRRLAVDYVAHEPFTGKLLHGQSASFGYTNYGGMLSIGVEEDALYIRLSKIFGFGHIPLRIPFADMSANVRKGWFFTYIDVSFLSHPGIRMRIFKSLAKKIEERSNGNWNFECE